MSVKPVSLDERLERAARDNAAVLREHPEAGFDREHGYVAPVTYPTHLAVPHGYFVACAAVDAGTEDGEEHLISVLDVDARAVDAFTALRELRRQHPDAYAKLVGVVVELERASRMRRVRDALAIAKALGWRLDGKPEPTEEPVVCTCLAPVGRSHEPSCPVAAAALLRRELRP